LDYRKKLHDIEYIVDNGTYKDRINWRTQLFVNGSNIDEYRQSFTYHSNYIEYGDIIHQTILDLNVNDTFYYCGY
jgi:hypothetical protein